MTPIGQLQEVVAAANHVVATMWVGQFDLPSPGGDGTAHDVLDRLYLVVAAATADLEGRGTDDLRPPFVYGWVPVSEFTMATEALLSVAPAADATVVQRVADEMFRLTAELAGAIGAQWNPHQRLEGATS